jgi:recombinational DNA repair protein RecT
VSRDKIERRPQGGAASLYQNNIEEVRALANKASNAAARIIGHDNIDRFMRVAIAHYLHADKPEAMHRVEPVAYMAAVMDAAVDRLLPDGRDGWIIPRGTTCSWHPSWRGLVKLARRATTVRELSAEAVYAADTFRIKLGSQRQIEHEPFIGPAEKRGEIIGVYAGARLAPTWDYEFRWIDEDRLCTVASMSGDSRTNDPSPVWIRHPVQMRLKHAIRMFLSWIEAPDEVLDVIAREDERERTRVAQVEDVPQRPNGEAQQPSLAEQIRGAVSDGEAQP